MPSEAESAVRHGTRPFLVPQTVTILLKAPCVFSAAQPFDLFFLKNLRQKPHERQVPGLIVCLNKFW